jgi:hypothetical protein
MKKYPILLLLVIACSTKPNDDSDKIKVFLTEWSQALQTKKESVRGFYDVGFVFPKVIFEAAEGLTFTLNVDSVTITRSEDESYNVTIPFQIQHPDVWSDTGSIVLTIIKIESGFLIRNMSQELAMEIIKFNKRLLADKEYQERLIQYDSIIDGIRAMATDLRQYYDSVVFFSEVDDQILFYVVNGTWEYPYTYEKQRDDGNYKMGVVTAGNKVIIPVEYSKIYNPNGSFDGMIEVENNGSRGLFRISGGEFIPADFESIYPTSVAGAFAQLKKGDAYGWVDTHGKVSFEPSSHANRTLFLSPIESNAILEWKFKFPGPISLLVSPYDDPRESTGTIVYPSFTRDLGVTDIAHTGVLIEDSEFGMGMTDTEIKFEKVESISGQLFGLISFFMEAGADARGYHSEKNDLLVVDKDLTTVGRLKGLTEDYESQDPCNGEPPSYRSIEQGLYQSEDGHGVYKYYKVNTEGGVEELKTDREYNFTKFAKIDESYFQRCHYEGLEYEEDRPNLVVINGISSEDLDVMRNEIFAEYGFIFKSPKWKAYFEAKPWYKPQYDNVDQFLTETDKANIKFILEYQRLHKNLQVQRDSIMFWWAG